MRMREIQSLAEMPERGIYKIVSDNRNFRWHFCRIIVIPQASNDVKVFILFHQTERDALYDQSWDVTDLGKDWHWQYAIKVSEHSTFVLDNGVMPGCRLFLISDDSDHIPC